MSLPKRAFGFERVTYQEGVVQGKEKRQMLKCGQNPSQALCMYHIHPQEGAKPHAIGPTKAFRGWLSVMPQAD